MRKIKVLLAIPDSADALMLRAALSTTQTLDIVGVSHSLTETYSLTENLRPDIVLLQRSLTLAAEFETMIALFEALETKWIVLRGRANDGVEARGASTKGLLSKRIAPLTNVEGLENRIIVAVRGEAPLTPPPKADTQRQKLVLIGASTGGVDALIKILGTYPENCPPTAIVQHTGAAFGEGLVRLLSRHCRANVVAARQGAVLASGTVAIATSSAHHLEIGPGYPIGLKLVDGSRDKGHTPSIDRLFQSAVGRANRTIGVLLTGMGKDGAQGLLALRSAGAHTIVQDQATCVVFGMPRVAYEMGAASQMLALPKICPAVLERCESASPSKSASLDTNRRQDDRRTAT